MKILTVNERINFKSHYPVNNTEKSVMRINRIDHYGHRIENNSNL